MNIAILIMSTNKEPCVRNISAMKNTIVKQTNEETFKHHYDFFEYYYDSEILKKDDIVLNKDCERDNQYPNYYYIRISGKESVYHTFEKTYTAYDYLLNNVDKYKKYDVFIRINISCYLNMKLLDAVLELMNKNIIYTNALNTLTCFGTQYFNKLYARGDFYIMFRDNLVETLKIAKQFLYCDQDISSNRLNIVHVDDVLFGCAFISYKGEEYYKYLQMIKYNFIPITYEPANMNFLRASINKYAISSRIKTTPPGLCSGYSWDDNEWRTHDPIKIEFVHNIVKQNDYSNINLENIFVSPLEEKHTEYFNVVSLKPHEIINLTTTMK